MTDSQMPTMKLEVVLVPVSDVDRAKSFYTEKLGFNADHDTNISDAVRLVQLTPPGSGCSIVIGVGMDSFSEMRPGSIKGLQLVVSDIEAVRAKLVERDVAVSAIQHYEGVELVDGHGGDWNSFIFFDDPDGNSWVIQKRPG